jgi:hypothetical protein
MRRISCLFGALILSIGLISCGGSSDGTITNPPPPPPTCAANTFCMSSGSSFFIDGGGTTLSVAANTAVTWTNDSGVPHDVTFDDPTTALAVGAGSAGNITQPASGSHQRQFAVSGSSHPFHCIIHGLVMHGTVTIL